MRSALTWLVTAALCAVAWLAWMGWDDEYQVDARTGEASGPYEAWQVIGSAVMLAVVVVVATIVFRDAVQVALAATAGYAIAWASTEMPDDDSGLSGVGLVMIVVGVGAASLVLALGTRAVRSRLERGRPHS
ncbi:hypothetical protein [Aeromicrobium wangtongii]|uniref:Tryptophan-associated transmembrane protein (Trp_oprn_chp) n=1 Tax=Aeromicrobium wangtongii TaxID=2969247 RepID=A0ABY5M7P5_9ACTN|nr:hypothetical protein [Aeromicrobium wangtongii]MCD9198856.1 hypothetical protein [Aeromicrobium wangtongii]UUP13104.1 hypothetical protein NQV15_14760 [Aeromicrobium wangtongii]